jgi:DNA-binding NtrC family response regulator
MGTHKQEIPARTEVHMNRVLLAGKDWQARALLRAQLIEEGVDVEAHESVNDARASLEAGEVLPALFIADLFASDHPAADIDELAKWSHDIPVWIIATHGVIAEQNLKGRGFELILFRPVDLGELVGQIKRRVESE